MRAVVVTERVSGLAAREARVRFASGTRRREGCARAKDFQLLREAMRCGCGSRRLPRSGGTNANETAHLQVRVLLRLGSVVCPRTRIRERVSGNACPGTRVRERVSGNGTRRWAKEPNGTRRWAKEPKWDAQVGKRAEVGRAGGQKSRSGADVLPRQSPAWQNSNTECLCPCSRAE
jgi:hypothetical protein